jgi:hypothetical protein
VIKKSLCTWWLQYRKLQVMFKVSPASLQTFIDTPNCVLEDHVQYSTVHIPNVFCDGHLQIISCVGAVRIHWVFIAPQVHRSFLITLYIVTLRSRICFDLSTSGSKFIVLFTKLFWVSDMTEFTLHSLTISKHVTTSLSTSYLRKRHNSVKG